MDIENTVEPKIALKYKMTPIVEKSSIEECKEINLDSLISTNKNTLYDNFDVLMSNVINEIVNNNYILREDLKNIIDSDESNIIKVTTTEYFYIGPNINKNEQ